MVERLLVEAPLSMTGLNYLTILRSAVGYERNDWLGPVFCNAFTVLGEKEPTTVEVHAVTLEDSGVSFTSGELSTSSGDFFFFLLTVGLKLFRVMSKSLLLACLMLAACLFSPELLGNVISWLPGRLSCARGEFNELNQNGKN